MSRIVIQVPGSIFLFGLNWFGFEAALLCTPGQTGNRPVSAW